MLQSGYYIIKSELLQEPVRFSPDSILVLQTDANGLRACYQIAGQLDYSINFCLYINIITEIDDKIAADIISFFFFPKYYKPQGIPKILLHCGKAKILRSFTEYLSAFAKAQGIELLNIEHISSDPGSNITIFKAHETEKIREAYKYLLKSSDPFTAGLYIEVLQPSNVASIDQLLEEEEKVFKEENNIFFTLKQQNRFLTDCSQQLEFNYRAAQREINNQLTHISILRSESQSTALQNYYDNEYELLPLWYKRLGHIIKVFIGKRTFRSLFNDNVKKYKD